MILNRESFCSIADHSDLVELYNNTDLGFPYWEWTENAEVPKLFEGLPYPCLFDRTKELGLVLSLQAKNNIIHSSEFL